MQYDILMGAQLIGLVIGGIALYLILVQPQAKWKDMLLMMQICCLLGMFGYALLLHADTEGGVHIADMVVFAAKCFAPFFALLAVTQYREVALDTKVTLGIMILDLTALALYCTNSYHHLYNKFAYFEQNGIFHYYATTKAPIGWLFLMVEVLQLFGVCVNCMMISERKILKIAGLLPLIWVALSFTPWTRGYDAEQISFLTTSFFMTLLFLQIFAERAKGK